MALSQSVVTEPLDALRAGDGVNLVRESVRLVLQELIEVEAAEVIGAAPYERTDTRVTERNGSRPRLLATQAGDIELAIPKLRKGSFFPSILEPRRRIDQALYAVVMEAYVTGVSTRAVDDLVAALGIASGISKSEVSRICAGLDEIVGAFRTRQLDHIEFPYVYLDATYLHVRNSTSQVVPMAVVVATGITVNGDREILGCDIGDSEDETFWRGFLRSVKARGLAGVRLVISDQRTGLVAALRRSFQGAAHQRCRVHFARNQLALVPRSHTDMVAAVFRTMPADIGERARLDVLDPGAVDTEGHVVLCLARHRAATGPPSTSWPNSSPPPPTELPALLRTPAAEGTSRSHGPGNIRADPRLVQLCSRLSSVIDRPLGAMTHVALSKARFGDVQDVRRRRKNRRHIALAKGSTRSAVPPSGVAEPAFRDTRQGFVVRRAPRRGR